MEILDCLYLPKPMIFRKFKQAHVPSHAISSKSDNFATKRTQHTTPSPICAHFRQSPKASALWIGAAGIALISLVGPSNAVESPFLSEPSNALSLPTWAIHVSSFAEWWCFLLLFMAFLFPNYTNQLKLENKSTLIT